VLWATNLRLLNDSDSSLFVTLFYATLDPVSGALDVFARYDDTQSRSAGFECPGR
jgi:hypothetical protein